MKTLFKLFVLLECKYNKLQFGIRISSIEARKQKLYASLRHSLSATKLTAKKNTHERLLSQEQRDSECFPVSISVCPAFLSRKLPETAVKARK